MGVDIGIKNICATSNGDIYPSIFFSSKPDTRRYYRTIVNEICAGQDIIVIEQIGKPELEAMNCDSYFIRTFLWIIKNEAKKKGLRVFKIDPTYTSQKCSSCGFTKSMPLNERIYLCSCGLMLDRDVNAAKNIRMKYLRSEGKIIEC